MKKLIVPLFFILSVNPIFCAEQPRKTREELIQDFTNVMTALYQKLVDTNIITIEHLKKLEKADKLISPLTQDERNGLSSDQLVRIKELEARLNVPVIMPQINGWARKTIMALTGEQETQKRVHEDTREVHRPMRFVEIPAGKYVDHITDEAFEVPEGVEMQDTPVTQWQWFHVMGSNPAHCVDGKDSTEVNKIKMVPNAPVENVSWNDVQWFIKKLNEKNDGYIYALPSVGEYQAVSQHALGQNWIVESIKSKHCNSQNPCSVPLFNHNHEIVDLVGNVWQWTRDHVEIKGRKAHLVFGTSYATDTKKIALLKDVVRPVFCCGSKDQILGLRLVRYKSQQESQASLHYTSQQLSWNQADSDLDPHWYWNDVDQVFMFKNEGLRWMFEHKNEYTQEIQHTLDVLLIENDILSRVYAHDDPADNLIEYCCLDLGNKYIQDISPFAHLTNLTILDLGGNQIEDTRPLTNLKKLRQLRLGGNKIKDVRPLANLKNLRELRLGWNQIEDVSPLANLGPLWNLHLNDNQIKDATPLRNVIITQDLYIKNNPICDNAYEWPCFITTAKDTSCSFNNINNCIKKFVDVLIEKVKSLWS